jgi:uncharacterized protein YcaQ
MSNTQPLITAESARLLLLSAQGLLTPPTRRVTRPILRSLIEQMGFVQLDSINVVERAHHLTLASRLDSYRHEQFTQLLEEDRSLFEHWTHDASAIPTKWFAHWKPRFERNRERITQKAWWRQLIGAEPDKVIDGVRNRIVKEGPQRSQDFENGSRNGSSAWWGWKPQKAALEYLWSTGELMVVRREGFQKVYDLTERVLPDHHGVSLPGEEEHIEWACSTALERLIVASPKEIADFWNTITLAQAREWCTRAADAGRVARALVQSLVDAKPKESFALPDWTLRLRRLPDVPDRIRLLCPFDPVLRDRARLARLFAFNYRFEAFVAAPKRKYGYYVLPIMEGDRFIGRLDPKFHRDRSVLEIRNLFWEAGVRVTRPRRRKLEEAAHRLAILIGAESIIWPG